MKYQVGEFPASIYGAEISTPITTHVAATRPGALGVCATVRLRISRVAYKAGIDVNNQTIGMTVCAQASSFCHCFFYFVTVLLCVCPGAACTIFV